MAPCCKKLKILQDFLKLPILSLHHTHNSVGSELKKHSFFANLVTIFDLIQTYINSSHRIMDGLDVFNS